MALTVGELVAYAKIDRSDFRRGTRDIASDLRTLQGETTSSMAGMEGSVVRSLADIQRAIADGLDPAAAIRELDRLEAALDQSLDDMLADADRFSEELQREIDDAFDELDRRQVRNLEFDVDADTSPAQAALAALEAEAERSGERAGDGFVRGADGRLRDARGRFVSADMFGPLVDGATDAGQKTGQALGDGVGVLGKLGPANVAIAATAIQLLPTVASVAAAGIGAALGGALLAVGFKGAASADRVQDAWKKTTAEIKAELADAAQPLEGSAIRAAEVTKRTFERLKPSLAKIWRDLVPDVDHFVEMAGQAVGSLGPTLERLGDSFGGVLSSLGDRMPAIVDNISATLDTFSAMMDEDPQMLANLVEDATQLLAVGAEVLAWADDISAAFSFISTANPVPLVDKIMGGSAADQVAQMEQVPKSMAAMNAAIAKAVESAQGLGGAAEQGADGVRSLNDALEEFFQPAQNALAAQNDWREALADANAALEKGNVSTLDRGRHLENLLGTLAQNAAMEKEATGATERSSAAFEKNIGALVRMAGSSATGREALSGLATSLGYTVTQAGKATIVTDELGNKIKILPDGKVSVIKADTKDANEKLDATKGKIGDVKDKKFKVDGDTKDAQAEVKKVVTGLSGLKGEATKAGQDMGSGLVAGIRSMIGSAITAAKDLAASALKGAKDFLGIKSPSTVMAEVGKWTAKGLIQGLTEEEGNVKATVERMVAQVKEAFSSRPDVADHLLAFIAKGNKNLEDLALQREALVQRLADAKEYAKKVAGDAQEWAAITGMSKEELEAGDFSGSLKSRAQAIKDFANDINALARRGLNKTTLRQIIDAGVEEGATIADMLVGAPGSEIKAINKAQAQIDNMSKQLGKSGADALYDVGKKAGDGYLKGLQESLKKLDKEMQKIVQALIKAIKKELKIKSPSQVMAEIGVFTMAGYIQGIESMSNAVDAAVQGMVGSAVDLARKAVAGHQPLDLGGASAGHVGGQGGEGFAKKYGLQPGQFGSGQPAPEQAPAGAVVQVDMRGAVIRDPVDVEKVNKDFGFTLMERL